MKSGKIVDNLDYQKDVEFSEVVNAKVNGQVAFENDNNKVVISKVNSLHPLALEWLKRDNQIPDKEIGI